MLPDLYQAECERIANQQSALLDDARLRLHDYLNVDPDFVNGLVLQNKHHFIADFLRRKISS